MIKLEHTVTPSNEQLIFMVEGMRNPMNSWDKSDSFITNEFGSTPHCQDCNRDCLNCEWYTIDHNTLYLGPEDRKLMYKLRMAGTDHRKFMRMMPVMVRITAPLYWWKEFDTYKVGTVANSCSTMHRIASKEFDISDFSTEHLFSEGSSAERALTATIAALNVYRRDYLRMKGLVHQKDIWWQMIQLLPSSYNQTRNVMLNYEVLDKMYHARKYHKLDEWVDFCRWIEKLPYFDLLIFKEEV